MPQSLRQSARFLEKHGELRRISTVLSPQGVIPEIARRADDYVTLEGEPITSDERFYRVRVTAFDVDTSGQTELERRMQMEPRWFTFAEVREWHEPIFPDTILDLVALDTTGETA